MHRLTVLCEDQQAAQVQEIADQYGVTEQEVIRQLIDVGLDHAERPVIVEESEPEVDG
jgi:hypothetical protein